MRHPYSPSFLPLPGFRPNQDTLWWTASVLLGSIVVADLLLLALVAAVHARWRRRRLAAADAALVLWFGLCAFLHCVFEGYFVLHHATLAGEQSVFAQLWKEYALSDSRYLASDPFLLTIEVLTVAIWGPLSLATTVLMAVGSPYRYTLQTVVSMGHLYGVVLYYATSMLEAHVHGVDYSRPEAQYFWLYYVGFNLPWAVVPLYILVRAGRAHATALTARAREAKKRR